MDRKENDDTGAADSAHDDTECCRFIPDTDPSAVARKVVNDFCRVYYATATGKKDDDLAQLLCAKEMKKITEEVTQEWNKFVDELVRKSTWIVRIGDEEIQAERECPTGPYVQRLEGLAEDVSFESRVGYREPWKPNQCLVGWTFDWDKVDRVRKLVKNAHDHAQERKRAAARKRPRPA